MSIRICVAECLMVFLPCRALGSAWRMPTPLVMRTKMAIDSVLGETSIEGSLKQFLLVLSVSLSVATLPKFFSWFRQIPYTLLLVIAGLGLALLDVRLIDLSPPLILFIFLPPLLFEAGWNLQWSRLKRDWLPIALYAVLGVLISIGGIAIGLSQLAGLSIGTALLLGASLSATDPISVIALFKELGVDKRLSTLMEGESLFNDGMAVVAFSFLLGFVTQSAELDVQNAILKLVIVVGLGVGIGSLIGFGISYLTQRFDLPLVEQSLTLVAAYGSYLLTEELGGSGVIGVVTTALILGNFGSRIGMNPRTRIIVSEFWEFIAFFVNSIVFLLIGDQVYFRDLIINLHSIAITIAAMIGTRAIAVYGLGFLSNRLAGSGISLAEHTLLWWGGLRGSVSIALALSVPILLPERSEVIATVFGVVLFTLLVQGLTVKPLLSRLNLLGNQPLQQQYIESIARRSALERVLQRLNQLENRPELDPEFIRYQTTLVKGQLERIAIELDNLQDEHPDVKIFIQERLRLELLSIEADTYAELVQTGLLNKELAPFLEVTEE